jgi:transcriptional regulator with XRE-family HTH domain
MKTGGLPTSGDSRSPAVVLTPAQLRAARALLGWSREDLAAKSGVGANTTKDFEINDSNPKLRTVQMWMRALEAAGVRFIDDGQKSEEGGPGVRLVALTKEGKRR